MASINKINLRTKKESDNVDYIGEMFSYETLNITESEN